MKHREDFYNQMKEDVKNPKKYIPEQKYVKLIPRELEKWDGNTYKGNFNEHPENT